VSETELAWAAGFFDGEGCARLSKSKTKKGKIYFSLQLSVAQKDERPLHRFGSAVRCGDVFGPYGRVVGCSMFYWRTTNVDGFERVVSLLWPYLSEPKREQIKSVIDTYYDQWAHGLKVKKTGDALIRLLAVAV
jgi:hypothetical protein